MATLNTRHSTPPHELSADARLERRLLLASGAFVAAAVPVAIIGFAATHGWGPLHDIDEAVATNLHLWALREPGAVAFLKGVSIVPLSALLRAPWDAIPNRFGKHSAAAHREAALLAGLPYSELPLASLAVDLDRIEDAEALLASPDAPRTRALLEELGLGRQP